MKIDNRAGINIGTAVSVNAKPNAQKIEEASLSQPDQVDTRLSQALQDALSGIQNSGLSAGAVHSFVDETRASGLLHSMDIEGKRPTLDNEGLLKMADRVSDSMANSPAQATAAFNELDGARVAELVA